MHLIFSRDEFGLWSWWIQDGGSTLAQQRGFDSHDDAVDGFRRLAGIFSRDPEKLLDEALVLGPREGVA